ncbi:50S ribosomal protein L1 [Patescibacteria group bacterium]|uniref:Large ribosomal subunit protein uL1 n=1 Tax=candidate division WWE3 bacterium TaxID=2053526 RepID=A0A928Y5R7_UNCKA|nr:50S ribosomal protein L1 [candidate division WWE3 bacterium]MCL4732373.1 50S ribosomal protein L1 [Patescibacteria group bacterium]MDL1952798.1 50S ribosomal protein L1 [Candidatus Uhrbacteria bacterium UHB]RIL01034.1 MAG: 50S ribosomal protein L1 [Candidatus Uhrbacteria bacterium]
MPKRSKRYTESKALIDSKKLYTPDEAVELVKKTATTKFESSVEVHVRLGIDVKQSDQQIRATITFPHSTGKTKKIAAFVPEAKQKEAKEAGADMVGAEDLIDEIAKTNKVDFDIAVATPDMMPKLAKIAKVLGPKGIMPNPKTDTVGPNVKKLVEDLKKGKVAYKNDAQGIVHQAIGKTSLNASALLENFQSLIESLRKHKPSSAKGLYFKSVTLSSTMGPGIKVDVSGI